MRPQLLIVPKDPNQSFGLRHDIVPHFFNKWHYHTELELIHIVKGGGTQFIGDHISRFSNGDILLIGSNLPHYWRCDENYFQDIPELVAEAKVVHFMQNFWGIDFLALPENVNISILLKKSQRGILITSKTSDQIKPLLDKMLAAIELLE